MFDKILKNYDLIKFEKTTLKPSEEALVYLVFKVVNYHKNENVKYVRTNFFLRGNPEYILKKTDHKHMEFITQSFLLNNCKIYSSESTIKRSPILDTCDELNIALFRYNYLKKLLDSLEADLLEANKSFCQE